MSADAYEICPKCKNNNINEDSEEYPLRVYYHELSFVEDFNFKVTIYGECYNCGYKFDIDKLFNLKKEGDL